MIKHIKLGIALLVLTSSWVALKGTDNGASGASTTRVSSTTSTSTSTTTTTTVPISISKWDTRSWDKTASWPDATDPTRKLSEKLQASFACIRYHESRNHLVDGNYSQGWYQFTLDTWNRAKAFIPGLAATPNKATSDQQSLVAVFYYQRNHSFDVEWHGDNACW